MGEVTLPRLPFVDTANQSDRRPAGRRPTLIVVHAWGNPPATTPEEARARFAGNVNYMQRRSSKVKVSAHVVYGGKLGDPRGQAAQLVRWERKAWTQAGLNSAALSVESADAIWQGLDEPGFEQLARIVAFFCHKTGIPPTWARLPSSVGVARHLDLGALGNPDHHADPTTSTVLWRRFVRRVREECDRGGFRRTWGAGTWKHL